MAAWSVTPTPPGAHVPIPAAAEGRTRRTVRHASPLRNREGVRVCRAVCTAACARTQGRVRGRHATASSDPYDDAESAAPPPLPAQPTVARILRVAALLLGGGLLARGALRLVMLGAAR